MIESYRDIFRESKRAEAIRLVREGRRVGLDQGRRYVFLMIDGELEQSHDVVPHVAEKFVVIFDAVVPWLRSLTRDPNRRVQDHDAFYEIRVVDSEPEAYRPAPVVHDQRDVLQAK